MEISKILFILLIGIAVGMALGAFFCYRTGYNRGWVVGSYDTRKQLEAPLDTAKIQYEQMYHDYNARVKEYDEKFNALIVEYEKLAERKKKLGL